MFWQNSTQKARGHYVEPSKISLQKLKLEVVTAKFAIYEMTEVHHGESGRSKQRGRYILGCYIQWALIFS